MKTWSGFAVVVAMAGLTFPASGLEPQAEVSFGDVILPILTKRCASCHEGNGGPLAKAEVDSVAAWIKAGAKNPPPVRTGLTSVDEALKAGKDGTKPVVLLFGDTTPKTKTFIQLLSDPSLDQSFMNVAYAAVTYEKDSEEAKKYKVTSAPTLLVLDPRPEAPKELKKLTSGAPAGVRSAIAAAVKSLSAK